MGCGCTSAKTPSSLPKAPLSMRLSHSLVEVLTALPSPSKYHSRLIKWSRIRTTKDPAQPPFAAFSKARPAKFTEKLGKGPSCEYRWEVWKAALGLPLNGNRYAELLAQPLDDKVASDIEKDVLRTYFEISYFKAEGRTALTNVLKCLALDDPEVGYCQGINFVVGLLLLISGGQEAETFAFYAALRKVRGWRTLYVVGFPGLWELTYQWRALFKEKDRELYKHFKAQGVQEGLWLTKCVMTIFAVEVPLALVVRLWDLVLCNDQDIFLKVGWTIIETIRSEVQGKDLSVIAEILRSTSKRSFDIEHFIHDVRRVNISKAVLERGSHKYQTKHMQPTVPAQVNVEV